MSSQPNICPLSVISLGQNSPKNQMTKLSQKLDSKMFTFVIWSHCTWTENGQSIDMRKTNICPFFLIELKFSHNLYHGPYYLDKYWTSILLLSSLCPSMPIKINSASVKNGTLGLCSWSRSCHYPAGFLCRIVGFC